jgi:uncharacterized membrane protein (DUF485 family)
MLLCMYSRETCCLDMTVLHIQCTSRLSFVVDTIVSLVDLSVYLLYLYFNFILINSIKTKWFLILLDTDSSSLECLVYMKYSHVKTACFSRTVNTTFVDWTNVLNARQMNVSYISDFIHGSIIIIPFGLYHMCKNVVIPRGSSYKQALGEDFTTVITTTVHIPGHLWQMCSEQSCVSWEANV